jgi:hypothetical protein
MSGKYRVRYRGREGSPPQNYLWEISTADRKVAEYGHDFRNDGRWILLNGREIAVVIDFFIGGGPQPLLISEEGEKLLDQLLQFD